MGKLRILSHNVWKCDNNLPAWEVKGLDCSADVRAEGMVRVYTETHPDIIGFQEMSYIMSERIICSLADQGYHYALLWGKDTPILYRRERLELLDSDFLMYPMEVPGFEGQFNNDGTKSWCIAVFRDKTDGKKLIFMTTHLWWKSGDSASVNYQEGSEEARIYQINMAIKRLEVFQAEYDCPIVLAGDFNADYTKPVIYNVMLQGY